MIFDTHDRICPRHLPKEYSSQVSNIFQIHFSSYRMEKFGETVGHLSVWTNPQHDASLDGYRRRDRQTDRQTDRYTDRHTKRTNGRRRQMAAGNDNNPAIEPRGNKNSNPYRTTVNPTGSTAKCVVISMNPIALSSVTISEYNDRILYHGICISGTLNIHQQCTLFNKEH